MPRRAVRAAMQRDLYPVLPRAVISEAVLTVLGEHFFVFLCSRFWCVHGLVWLRLIVVVRETLSVRRLLENKQAGVAYFGNGMISVVAIWC